MWTNGFKNTFNIAAKFNGNKQYPNKQIDWKKLIVPPSSCPLIAIIAPPSHTITNTISNNSVLSSAFVVIDNILQGQNKLIIRKWETYDASIRQKKNGPQRSQFLISLRLSALSTTGLIGFNTMRNFYQIRRKSRFFNNFICYAKNLQ